MKSDFFAGAQPVRIAIVNLMPKAEVYEQNLVRAFVKTGCETEFIFVKLKTHVYKSSSNEHLNASYVSFDEVIHGSARRPDALLVTGAPVELLPFEDVHYWDELASIIAFGRQHFRATLGLCWGALAIAKTLGVDKTTYSKKVFGIYTQHAIDRAHPVGRSLPGTFMCPHSRFAGLDRTQLDARAREGKLVVVAQSDDGEPTPVATRDGSTLMHLGHPEYDSERIAFEWQRDAALGRSDVPFPRGYDPESRTPAFDWRDDSDVFFRAWLASLTSGR